MLSKLARVLLRFGCVPAAEDLFKRAECLAVDDEAAELEALVNTCAPPQRASGPGAGRGSLLLSVGCCALVFTDDRTDAAPLRNGSTRHASAGGG